MDFNLASVSDYIRRIYPTDTKLLNVVKEKEKDLEQRVGEAEEVMSRYRRLATLGMLVDTVLHEGRLPLAKIKNISYIAMDETRESYEDCKKLIRRINAHFRAIIKQSDVITTLFRKIEPFGGRRRGRPEQISLETVITRGFSVLDKEVEQVGVLVDLPLSSTLVTLDQSEIQEVIVNLLNNSLYWLRKVPKDLRYIYVGVERKEEYELEILFSDSGPGIEEEYADRIFDPYFSTKPNGIGLGLTITGEIVSDYYDGSISVLKDGPLEGATFRIILRRRI